MVGAVAFAALGSLPPAKAQTTDESALLACKVIIDRAAELIRIGETKRARRLKPQLEQCLPIIRAKLDREARKIIDDFYAEFNRQKAPDSSK